MVGHLSDQRMAPPSCLTVAFRFVAPHVETLRHCEHCAREKCAPAWVGAHVMRQQKYRGWIIRGYFPEIAPDRRRNVEAE